MAIAGTLADLSVDDQLPKAQRRCASPLARKPAQRLATACGFVTFGDARHISSGDG